MHSCTQRTAVAFTFTPQLSVRICDLYFSNHPLCVTTTPCIDVGVITRSCFWLVYWRPRHLDDEHGTFGKDLPWAVSATVIEVRDHTLLMCTGSYYNEMHDDLHKLIPYSVYVGNHATYSYSLIAQSMQHWVFFWYNATYFWTFFFAVDVYNAKHGGKWKLCCSHFFTWFFCFVYIAGSMCSLWTCPPYLE